MTLFKSSSNTIFTCLWNMNLHVFLFYITLLLFSFSSQSASSFPTTASYFSNLYSNHCSSFVPEPPRERLNRSHASPLPDLRPHSGYYVTAKPGVPGTSKTLELSNYLSFHFIHFYETDIQGLVSVEASIRLFTTNTLFHGRNGSNHYSDSIYEFRPVNSGRKIFAHFSLRGFWSESHGRLCVVGHGYNIRTRQRGESTRIPVFLKLYNLYNSTNLNSLVTGSLESLVGPDQTDPNLLYPISLMLLPQINYEYTLVSQALVEFESSERSADSPLDSMIASLCTILKPRPLSLKYSRRCRSYSLAKNCSPFGGSHGQLPDIVKLELIECAEDVQALRFLIRFPINTREILSYRNLDPKATLIAEGVWDSKINQLFLVVCRFLNATDSWAEARVSDCSMRLSLKFPEIWTIGNTSIIVGRLWSTKDAADSGHFDEIRFKLTEDSPNGVSGMKYEYTKLDLANKWCPSKEATKIKKGKTYPDAFSTNMAFDIIGVRDNSQIARGDAQVVAVGNELYGMRWDQKNFQNHPINMSYFISLFNVSWESYNRFDISTEGVYDASTGSLCMIGCRKIGLRSFDLSSNDDSTFDCEIVVNFQFPPTDPRLNEGVIKGRIESKRKKSDPLYFKRLEIFSAAYVDSEMQEIIWMADWEISLALISNTLACVFAVFQIFHLRRNPDFCPFVSLTMLLTLTLINIKALAIDLNSTLTTSFESQYVLLGSGGWLQTKGVTEGVMALVLVLLQARLLQLTWFARLSHKNQHELRVAENEALVVSLPLYFGGAFVSVVFAWSNRNRDLAALSSALIMSYNENPIWEASKSYANLLSESFLLPQILLNMFRDSRDRALSIPFYIGTTLVRILPHAFGLYKAQNSGLKLVSTLWDVIIPFVSLIFAAIVYLQQKFGGRCIISFGSRDSNVYEKVSDVAAET